MLQSKILRNKFNVIREGVNAYKCSKCETVDAGKVGTYCKEPNCGGVMRFWKRIPQEKVEEITSRRAAKQCPSCMRTFFVWVEQCPYCVGTPLIKGKILKKDHPLAKLFNYQHIK